MNKFRDLDRRELFFGVETLSREAQLPGLEITGGRTRNLKPFTQDKIGSPKRQHLGLKWTSFMNWSPGRVTGLQHVDGRARKELRAGGLKGHAMPWGGVLWDSATLSDNAVAWEWRDLDSVVMASFQLLIWGLTMMFHESHLLNKSLLIITNHSFLIY